MSDHKALEEGLDLQLDFGKLVDIGLKGCKVVPCAVQDADTKELILVAYVNQDALDYSIQTGTATFWSTSRNELWIKGATSGATFDLVGVFVNCEQNSLLFTVRPRNGGICHTKNKNGEPRNCYYRKLDFTSGKLENINP